MLSCALGSFLECVWSVSCFLRQAHKKLRVAKENFQFCSRTLKSHNFLPAKDLHIYDKQGEIIWHFDKDS